MVHKLVDGDAQFLPSPSVDYHNARQIVRLWCRALHPTEELGGKTVDRRLAPPRSGEQPDKVFYILINSLPS